MPLIQLLQLQYKDMEDSRKVADVYNENIRQLEWLLSHNLDSANLKTDAVVPATVADSHGLNPEYIKYYPNKCFNSSFEVYDAATILPSYWDTDGAVSPDAVFDGTYSLKLAPGQHAIQKVDSAGLGLANPAWWSWCIQQAVAGATRFSFRLKGTLGMVRVSVWQTGASVPLWVWKTDTAGEEYAYKVPAPYYLDVATSSDWARPDAANEWATSLRTFGALPSITGGVISLRFDNIGTADVYIDAVTEEADWTGKWPSFYTPGPMSDPVTSSTETINPAITPQLQSLPYNSAGVTFTLATPVANIYPSAMIVTSDSSPFVSSSFELICVPIISIVNGRQIITGCYVYPKGSSVPSSAPNAQISLIVFGTPVGSASWTDVLYYDVAWGASVIIDSIGGSMPPWHSYPTNWPDAGAYWIWGIAMSLPAWSGSSIPADAPAGDNYFRKKIHVSAITGFTVYIACDNSAVLWLDNSQVASVTGWTNHASYTGTLLPGDHEFAIRATSVQSPVPNPAGLVVTIIDANGNILAHSDASWKCLAYPSPAPT